MVDEKEMMKLAEKAAAAVAGCNVCKNYRQVWCNSCAGYIPCPNCRPAPAGSYLGAVERDEPDAGVFGTVTDPETEKIEFLEPIEIGTGTPPPAGSGAARADNPLGVENREWDTTHDAAGHRINLDPNADPFQPRAFDRLSTRLQHVFKAAVRKFHGLPPDNLDERAPFELTAYLDRYDDESIARMAREYAGRYEASDRADDFRKSVYLRAVALILSEFPTDPAGADAVNRMVLVIAKLPPFKPIARFRTENTP